MIFKKAAVTAISTITLMAQQASAAWLYETKESAFDDATMHVAATAGSVGGFAVRCQGDHMDVVYMISSTDISKENVEQGNELKLLKLKLRVDKGDVVVLDAAASVPGDRMLMLKAEIDRSQAEQIRDAKKSVAAALTMGGQNFYEDSFSASGSTDTVGKVLSECSS